MNSCMQIFGTRRHRVVQVFVSAEEKYEICYHDEDIGTEFKSSEATRFPRLFVE